MLPSALNWSAQLINHDGFDRLKMNVVRGHSAKPREGRSVNDHQWAFAIRQESDIRGQRNVAGKPTASPIFRENVSSGIQHSSVTDLDTNRLSHAASDTEFAQSNSSTFLIETAS
jgi:hypothetical protein